MGYLHNDVKTQHCAVLFDALYYYTINYYGFNLISSAVALDICPGCGAVGFRTTRDPHVLIRNW